VSQINEMELDEEKDKYFESLANMETLIKITTPKKMKVSTRTPRFEDQDTPLFIAEVKHVQGQILLNFLVVMSTCLNKLNKTNRVNSYLLLQLIKTGSHLQTKKVQ
jgi:hypothetical protein